jgi:hypothetical protein
LCECDNAPNPDNQDAVAKRLLEDRDGVVYLTEFKWFNNAGRLVQGPEQGGVEQVGAHH